ncbi:carbohydrate kinase family protein [Methanofollis fontis]|uniref:Sugar kinase n=1 Tax=Methanofollis fontis TaxID=2052832 RepID=A0A483CYD6_9EURY|nr:carbohydrate kinase family protein [Methanofollis fontis]TAJ44636.1 sugar kinase [Methanofollis fontis]
MISIVGHTAVDHICRVPFFPERHTSVYTLDHRIFFGGGAANIAAGIATLGECCELVSAVGSDFPGGAYERHMADLGIVPRFFQVDDRPTATAFMFNDAEGDQITFFDWGASAVFADAEAPSLPFVHMATADPSFNVRVAERSEFASFDPGQDILKYDREQFEAILEHISILFANRHEAARMAEVLGISMDELADRVEIAVFTMDSAGCMLCTGGERRTIPAVRVEAEDPTGAGDAFRAGFLTAYLRGLPPVRCCTIGTVTASFAVERMGCQTNLPTWERMAERHRQHFGPITEA